MAIIYRHATFDDIVAVSQVNQTAINDLNRRHGFPEFPPSPPSPLYSFSLTEEPEGFWVAEDDGTIAGYSISWVRGTFWFLYDLFVLPEYQGTGIGQKLIQKAFEHSAGCEIDNRALITFAYNPISISLYIKYGMYPREPLYLMEIPRAALRGNFGRIQADPLERVKPSGLVTDQLGGIDEQVLGISRAKHHVYLLNAPGSACYIFKEKDNVRGYAYVWSSGRVGPLAVLSHADFDKLWHSALVLAAASDAETIRMLVPGTNEQAASLAHRCRFRISHPMLLMSAKPFGTWQNYSLYSPGLM